MPPLILVSSLSKSFGGVHALKTVSIEIAKGEIHALCGENGAGKSTLIKSLTGVVTPEEGTIAIDGNPLQLGNVQASEAAGIAVIHQESTAFPNLNTLDNIYVGREPIKASGLFLDKARMRHEANETLKRLGQDFDIDCPVIELSVAQRQMVAMARALSQKCRFLILDEPTASLSARETDSLLAIVRQLRDEGVTVLYVSHRLAEIFAIADRVTVLRDGECVDTQAVEDLDRNALICLMVGRELDELTQRHEHAGEPGEVKLQVSGLTSPGVFHGINLGIHAGEIVGLAGLVGAGRSEVARAIFGIDSYTKGQVKVDGQPLTGGSVAKAMSAGVSLVPEDRQHEGLILPMSVGANLSLAVLPTMAKRGMVDRDIEREVVGKLISDLLIKTAGQDIPAETLSGGNPQKLVIGKWMAAKPQVLILDEPTRGVDIAAKAQVHRLIRNLASKGLATLIISSDMNEILSISDRIVVMREGRISGEISGREATREMVLELALPQEKEALA